MKFCDDKKVKRIDRKKIEKYCVKKGGHKFTQENLVEECC